MSADHEALVLEAAAAILRARGHSELAGQIGMAEPEAKSVRTKPPSADASILQRRLYDSIIKAGMTPRSLSIELFDSAELVRSILAGRSRDPGATRIFKIADALGVDARWLVGYGEGA